MSKRSRRKAAAKQKFPVSWIVALLVVLVGFALGPTAGKHFVFRFGDQYDHVALIAFLVLMPAIAVIRLLNSKGKVVNHHPKQSAMFAFINWVLSTALIAAVIIFSPYGYVALYHQAIGDDLTVAAKVCRVHDMTQRRGRGCNRGATLMINGREHGICLAHHYAPNTPLIDQDVMVSIRQSWLGFSIGELKLTH